MTATVVLHAGDRAPTQRLISPQAHRDRRRWRFVGLGLAIALMVSSRTLQKGKHYQVDVVYWGYHVHIYQVPTTLIWFAHSTICDWNPACTLKKVKEQVEANKIFLVLLGVDKFFDDDVDDFNEALRSTPHPWPINVNVPEQYGCLGGYRNTRFPWNDGDWYGDPPDRPWCHLGQ